MHEYTFWEYWKSRGLSKREFKELLFLSTKESYLIFNGKLYKQVNEVTMGSNLNLKLTSGLLVYFEENWL